VGVEFVVVGGSLRWPIMQFGNSGVDQEYPRRPRFAAQQALFTRRESRPGHSNPPIALGSKRLKLIEAQVVK